MAQPKKADITIDGQGFYTISGQTRKGNRFMRRVQGNEGNTAYCDDTSYTQNIANGAIANGLTVEVNGKEYPNV